MKNPDFDARTFVPPNLPCFTGIPIAPTDSPPEKAALRLPHGSLERLLVAVRAARQRENRLSDAEWAALPVDIQNVLAAAGAIFTSLGCDRAPKPFVIAREMFTVDGRRVVIATVSGGKIFGYMSDLFLPVCIITGVWTMDGIDYAGNRHLDLVSAA